MTTTNSSTRDDARSQREERQRFLADVLTGLRQTPKVLPCKYFYDANGSRLFEEICKLDEYYLTRTELAIMQRRAGEIAGLIGPNCALIEYGSGASIKTRLLLDHLGRPTVYIPIDMSEDFLYRSAREIAVCYPSLEVKPLCADFTAKYVLPVLPQSVRRRVIYFPGSTIGNFGPAEADRLLARMAAICGTGSAVLLGFDLQKDLKVLLPAYDDAKGVTRDFNLNLLARINRELEANFDLDAFQHCVRYNRELNCIEMYLISKRAQDVEVAGQRISLAANESIRTERSHKYDIETFSRRITDVGLRVEKIWTDQRKYFAVAFLTVPQK
jgi:dimethylhistidine N-methyltransferase